MATERTVARQPAGPERRRPVAPPVVARLAAPATSGQVLQRRLGTSGVGSLLASQTRTQRDEDKRARESGIPHVRIQRAALPVSSPTDPPEREATRIGDKVARMAMPAEAPPVA